MAWKWNEKIDFFFFFLLKSGSCLFSISIFSYLFFHNSPIVRKIGGTSSALRRAFAWSGQILSNSSEWKEVLREVVFARWFKNPDGNVRRVPVVRVIPILTYFNFCPFSWICQIIDFPKETSSFSYPIMGICRWSRFEPCPPLQRGDGSCHLSIIPQWTGVVVVPTPFPLSSENLLTNSWSLVFSSFPWTPPVRHINICCGRLSGSEGFGLFKQVRRNHVGE